MKKAYFISGIGTDVGKTIASAICVQALQADYWKPVQAGTEPQTDTERVSNLIHHTSGKIWPERYVLQEPASPHYAAALEGIEIKLEDFELPQGDNHIIVEGAGGLLVPLNNAGDTVTDLAERLELEVILVSRHYLGSINHSLLSIAYLQNKNIPIKGILFSGDENPATEAAILNTGVQFLGRINEEESFDTNKIQHYAATIKSSL